MSDNNHTTTVIRNATVYTGELNECFVGDVAIRDDRITALGDCSRFYSKQDIDATGLTLAPGFIDVHTHDDLEVLRNPHMLCKVSQGVTTVITGNCGISSVPCVADIEPVDPINLLGQKADFKYPNLADFRNAFDDIKPSVNLAQLIGHTSLRAQVMNDLSKAASEQEINQMQSLLRTQMEQGALGLST
ncbi:MAG: amidohydrolase family protein, partial [Pseudoalteromonas spongiae]